METMAKTILVVDADAARRAALARALAGLRPGARVLAAASWGEARGRLARERPAPPVVALTDDLRPDTLMRAEAAGVVASLRTPADLRELETVLGFLDEKGFLDERGGAWS